MVIGQDFKTFYIRLQTGASWEEESRTGKYADLIVQVNETNKLVFWRGNSYLPYWETTNGTWNVPEIVTRNGDGIGVMHDKVNTFSPVKLIHTNAVTVEAWIAIELTLGFATSVETEESYTISIDNFEGVNIENASVFLIDHYFKRRSL